MSKSYYEKLKDERWKQKRLEILKRDNFTCCGCGSTNKPLHVHHGMYAPDYKNPWDYPSVSMWTLCEDCHKKAHDYLHDAHIELSKINPMHVIKVVPMLHAKRSELGGNAHQKIYKPSTGKWVEPEVTDE